MAPRRPIRGRARLPRRSSGPRRRSTGPRGFLGSWPAGTTSWPATPTAPGPAGSMRSRPRCGRRWRRGLSPPAATESTVTRRLPEESYQVRLEKEPSMRSFDVQSIPLDVPRNQALSFIADPTQLPKWTNAFASVSPGRAVLRTPGGEVTIDLLVAASREHGTVDWRMTFPDGSVARAFSRVLEISPDRCVYCFVLTPPPVPLEELEGTMEAQSRTLGEELKRLKGILERRG